MVLSKDKTVIVHLNEDDWRELAWIANGFGKNVFTINLRDPDFTTPVQRIAVIAVRGDVVALSLGRSLGRSGDLDTRVKFSHVHVLQPAALEAVIEKMKLNSYSSMVDTIETGGLLPQATGRKFFDALSELSPESSRIVEKLRALQLQHTSEMTDHHRLLEEQRDAVAVSLEVAGIDSRSALQNWEVPPANAPFLAGLNPGGTSEASLIRHDATQFENWLRIEGQIYDVVEFVDPHDPSRKVTIAYADKEPLERVTGTDLIYFRHQNPGYVLVQYKRMMQRSGEGSPLQWLYRPDGQLTEEIRRMRQISVSGTSQGVGQWRLSQEPFYIKLCEDLMDRPGGRKLTKGMYFPLGLFEEILESPKILGPKGGKGIGWHNAQRWLSNTGFIELRREGWIGSVGDVTSQITALVQRALEGDRGVILARDDSQFTERRRIGTRRA
ncbi:hypothetical protein [Arthrobacter sp. efr-133-TYG-118]|uniref:hypothetical protein n=1 Tax=Arthrobacter sp. efr-133-TYG-118 TaxID=3040279 RepID=UPI002550F281|nr:hypothetical protein [Arthrobacter sp. efr-133-TYG-118]